MCLCCCCCCCCHCRVFNCRGWLLVLLVLVFALYLYASMTFSSTTQTQQQHGCVNRLYIYYLRGIEGGSRGDISVQEEGRKRYDRAFKCCPPRRHNMATSIYRIHTVLPKNIEFFSVLQMIPQNLNFVLYQGENLNRLCMTPLERLNFGIISRTILILGCF